MAVTSFGMGSWDHRSVDDNVDDLIIRILSVATPGFSLVSSVKEGELMNLCTIARQVFLSQASLLDLKPPVKICGDIHGQYADLLRLLDRSGFPPFVNYSFWVIMWIEDNKILNASHYSFVTSVMETAQVTSHFFMEAIVQSLQAFQPEQIKSKLQIKYPGNFFILRGNHECSPINRVYGFFEECNRRYQSTRLWLQFQDAFATLPFTALISGKILCMHGGLSPKLKSMEQLRQITRPIDPPNPSLHIDLLWSDPDNYIKGWASNSRGVSYVFGPDVVYEMSRGLNIELVARAHQVVQDGYEFFANRKLVTIFSAPHYCGQFDNAAAVMNVDENLLCSFKILRPTLRACKVQRR